MSKPMIKSGCTCPGCKKKHTEKTAMKILQSSQALVDGVIDGDRVGWEREIHYVFCDESEKVIKLIVDKRPDGIKYRMELNQGGLS